ncbi:prefoldin subunit 1 [Cryptococcus wingfieldii CBS 7118]|uniref:Prefoldin subunit 1 n=1 Tax=Cryptococcus wingfieldii CBS 7118 TaxID=1295528 RepID=A0A1E3IGK5_9TREE|nr:prefoldin subunit 1 [Cryptococcus wingfieldii CBS 7118]ODN87720.1 prefoldin subunit 1 [Cryptococcus wingfieldii CBS 7118]
MSALSDDTLRKILTQIQTQAISSQKQLSIVRSQIASKDKEKKILALTRREIGDVPVCVDGQGQGGGGKMYKGVGKMFVEQSRAEVEKEHADKEKSLTEDVQNLSKKAKYLEKQFEESNNQLKDIFHAQQRAAENQ